MDSHNLDVNKFFKDQFATMKEFRESKPGHIRIPSLFFIIPLVGKIHVIPGPKGVDFESVITMVAVVAKKMNAVAVGSILDRESLDIDKIAKGLYNMEPDSKDPDWEDKMIERLKADYPEGPASIPDAYQDRCLILYTLAPGSPLTGNAYFYQVVDDKVIFNGEVAAAHDETLYEWWGETGKLLPDVPDNVITKMDPATKAVEKFNSMDYHMSPNNGLVN